MNVVCIGAGYVGSVTGASFAALGHQTTIIDVDQAKIDLLNVGKSPIYEPGLDELIAKYIGNRLFATTSYDAVREADVVFIGVGTPSNDDGTADLTYVKAAAHKIAENLSPSKFTVVVNKSTVPVGTADAVSSIVQEVSGLNPETDYAVVSNPEFLREGFALEDVFFPDRVVIGTTNEQAKQVMRELYHNLVERINYETISQDFHFNYCNNAKKPIYFETDTKSAEMIKYAANAFLAIKISYINEVARLCDALGADVVDVARGMGLDTRIGDKFLQVSPGWSGSCFPKDTAEFLATSRKCGSELLLVKSAIESNLMMHEYVIHKMEQQLQTLKGKMVGVLGLTFKPNTDDARMTQASYIIKRLIEQGATVYAHDPKGIEMFQRLHSDLPVQYCNSSLDVVNNADALLLLTHWDEYYSMDWERVYRAMNNPYIMDTRNFLPKEQLLSIGFTYEGLGIATNKHLKREVIPS